MILGIDWTQASTQRGSVWVIGAIIATAFYAFGKDPMPIMLATSTMVGGLGLTVKD
jgi:hypothetical protein